MKGFPLEFGIGARGPECFYDGADVTQKTTTWGYQMVEKVLR